MNETSYFGATVLGLVVACVAEHLIKDKTYYKGTLKEKIWLVLARTAIALLALMALLGAPNMSSDLTCKPDPESATPSADCN